MFEKLNKKEAVVFVALMIGIAWVFFILGMCYTAQDHLMLLDHIQIKEMIIDINESELVDYTWEKVSYEENNSSWKFNLNEGVKDE